MVDNSYIGSVSEKFPSWILPLLTTALIPTCDIVRFMQLGTPTQPLSTEDPSITSFLPSDDQAFDEAVRPSFSTHYCCCLLDSRTSQTHPSH
jgi:hypothetical protein